MSTQLSPYFIDVSSSPQTQIEIYGLVNLRHKDVIDYVYTSSKQSVVDSWKQVMKQLTKEELQDIERTYKVRFVSLASYLNDARLLNRMSIEHGFNEIQDIIAPYIKKINGENI